MLNLSFFLCTAVPLLFPMVMSASISKGVDVENSDENYMEEMCSFLTHTRSNNCSNFWAGQVPPVILISLDGFRPEYLSRFSRGDPVAPTISCLSKHGVSAPSMMPSYPTITFPNHYSIVTGLYPESHQIIGNQFYDPDLKADFNIRNPDGIDPKWWVSGEPIWSTIRRQGKISATYFWPGSDVRFPEGDQRSPNYFFKYNRSTSFIQRVDQVLDWISLPVDKRPVLTTLYFEEPDSIGHKEGPNSANVTEKVILVDQYIRRLFDGLIDRNVWDCVNVIVVSDHGMADSPPNQLVVDLQKYVADLKESAITFYGPVTSIRPLNNTIEEENRIGVSLACKDSHMRVFNKWELPFRMHSAQSRRIPKLILDMDLSWRGVYIKDPYGGNGGHGWDNLYPEMQAIFLARGPSFKSEMVTRPFENVQLYNLICALVNVTPAENNGTWGALHHLLVDPPHFNRDLIDLEEFPAMPTILRTQGGFKFGSKMNHTICDSINSQVNKEKTLERVLNKSMTEERESELLAIHAPLGIPIDLHNEKTSPSSNKSKHVLLVNEDYLIGFDTELGLPLWTSYTVSNETIQKDITKITDKWAEDPRFEDSHLGSCARLTQIQREQEIVYTHLFPRDFASREEDVWLDSNLLEIPAEMSGVIQTMTQMLADAAAIRGTLNVISGPTRHHPAAQFYVVTACRSNTTVENSWNVSSCPAEDNDLQAFLLPIRQWKYQTCNSDRDFIANNVATLKDVEKVTDFVFFPDLPIEERLNLLVRTTLDSKLVVDPTRS